MDIYDEIIDHEANLFYDNVRTFIVVFLTVASLLPASYVLLNSRRKNKEAYLSKDDVTVHEACFSSPNFYYSWPIQFLGDIICCIDSALLLTQQSISYIGLALLLVCMPSGICGLILKMISFSHSAQPHYQISSTATYHTDTEYRFQLEKCLQYIKTLNKPFHQSTDQLVYQIGAHSDISCQLPPDGTAPPLKLNEVLLKRPSSVLSTIAFVLLMIVFIASAVSTSVNIIAMLYSLLILRGEETADRSSVGDYIILGHESVSKFGFFGAFLQKSIRVFTLLTPYNSFLRILFREMNLKPFHYLELSSTMGAYWLAREANQENLISKIPL
ncbi:hypothetical protein ACTXT7_016541, partial [Hymenolepis weldensis]